MSLATFHQVLPSKEFGGAAEVAFRLMEHGKQAAPGRTCLWLPGKGRAWQKAADEQFETQPYELPDVVRASKPAIAMANLRAGWKWRRFRPGVLHLHSAELYGGLPLACGLSGLQRIVHIHLEQEEATVRWAFRRMPELIVTCAGFLVENVRRFLPSAAQEKARIVSVPNCIDTTRFCPGDRRAAKVALGADPQLPLVLMLANLAPHKGQETAIRAIALLKQRNVDVCCWLAGVDREESGTYEAKLQSLIAELGVHDRVKLLGFRSDGAELLRAADCFLLPSTREGLPLSVLEAQASNVPVLAAPTAGIPEVVTDGSTGFLIGAYEVEKYAKRIEELTTQPAMSNAIAAQALKQVREKHQVQAYCERMWGLYEQLLSAPFEQSARKVALL